MTPCSFIGIIFTAAWRRLILEFVQKKKKKKSHHTANDMMEPADIETYLWIVVENQESQRPSRNLVCVREG